MIEVAVEPLFHVPFKCQDNGMIVQARLLRAKSRIPRGSYDAVYQGLISHFGLMEIRDWNAFLPSPDLRAILLLDPNHLDARELLTHINGMGKMETSGVTVGLGTFYPLRG